MTLDLLSTKAALERLTGMAEKQKWRNGQTAETMEPQQYTRRGLEGMGATCIICIV